MKFIYKIERVRQSKNTKHINLLRSHCYILIFMCVCEKLNLKRVSKHWPGQLVGCTTGVWVMHGGRAFIASLECQNILICNVNPTRENQERRSQRAFPYVLWESGGTAYLINLYLLREEIPPTTSANRSQRLLREPKGRSGLWLCLRMHI